MQNLSPIQSNELTDIIEPKTGNGSIKFGETDKFRHESLVWNRLFGKGDPYDAIRWEIRTAKITKGNGEIVFEQNGVEVPDFWSQTATDIVASKYFRGQQGTPERECSARQMVDRVVATIAGWGFKDGYFKTQSDYENFKQDLKFLLINQYAAFNSPVWFNVGVYERPQCSACFILAVEDNMQSILEWYRDEGWIFKFGSGSGINLSTLRSSKEPLSRGGRSSGPISFMKGADGVANSIRSGGTTRRAAKMVVLNADHPDIKDFIYCKKIIEDMTKVLENSGMKATIEADLFNPYTLLPYQNANNSVRATDEFMKRIEADENWELKSVTSGETLEIFKAREVMDWITDAAWHSADPGMQFDTTINDWHTCPNSGRINASNPCITGDALVATKNGLKKIKDLIGTTLEILTPQGLQKTSKVFSTGVKKVFRLTTKSGYTLRLTADHKVTVSGRGDVPAKELKPGDRLQLMGSNLGTKTIPKDLALALGYAIGDGCISHQTRGNKPLTWVGGEDDMLILQQIADTVNGYVAASLNISGKSIQTIHVHASTPGLKVVTSRPVIVELMSEYAVLDRGSANKDFTDNIFDLDREIIANVLRGLFTADGTVSGNQEKGYYVGLDSISLKLLQKVQLLLLSFGVKSRIYRNRRNELVARLPNAKRELQSYNVQQIHSLRITKSSRVIFEHEIGFAAGTKKSFKLGNINRSTEAYADRLEDEFATLVEDGVEQVYDLTEPVTSHFIANGIVIHNCSEYMHLDNSACNLASLNLLRFLETDGSFNIELFKKSVDTLITAQEIIVGNSSYPTEKITQNALDFRELGLGYANLGSLLMNMGLAYDSDRGRAVAGAITSIMCGNAYSMSARLAAIKGPFAGYELNRESMLRVMRKHGLAAQNLASLNERAIDGTSSDAKWNPLIQEAINAWHDAIELGQRYGYRNSQATVLAPTGTIAFLMDCDTTGVEPELALIKYKKLVGGGTLKLVNGQVPPALKKLGYDDQQISDISAYLLEKETIESAPYLKNEHLPIFDCSFKAANGTRSISYMGHIKMMGAVQPFISGAISKTVNLPNNATKEDIRDAFVQSWKLGLKAVAVYRDGCKSVQPLNTSTDDDKKESPETQTITTANLVEKVNGYTRVKLPNERPSITHKFSLGNHEGYLTVGLYPDSNKPGETFITIAKEGSTISGLFDVIATLTSMCLQSGVPLKTLVKKFKDLRFEPSGITSNSKIPFAKSFVDYIFKYLGYRFLSADDKEEIFGTPHEELSQSADRTELPPLAMETITIEPAANVSTVSWENKKKDAYTDAPVCECGAMMFKAGSCYTCPNCFNTTGVCN